MMPQLKNKADGKVRLGPVQKNAPVVSHEPSVTEAVPFDEDLYVEVVEPETSSSSEALTIELSVSPEEQSQPHGETTQEILDGLSPDNLVIDEQDLKRLAEGYFDPVRTENPTRQPVQDAGISMPLDQHVESLVFEKFKPMPDARPSTIDMEDPYRDLSTPTVRDYDNLQAAPATRYSMLLFFIVVAAVLIMGWLGRAESQLTAKTGLGYNLGIIGGTMMLLLVLYPIRKKFSGLRFFGPTKFWFHLHMVFGTLGPALVLFHANFSLGSINSTVAMAFTLLVAASGFFHMFIYTKIHYSLHGKRMTLQELQEKTEVNRSSLQHIFTYAPKLKERLLAFENQVLTPPYSVAQSVIRILTIGIKTRWNYALLLIGLRRGLKVTAKRAGWPAAELRIQNKTNQRFIAEHMKTILKIVEYNFYERLFAQWYLFHGPLFYMLIFVGFIHVLAVHMY